MVQRAEHQVDVVLDELPQVALLGQQRLGLVVGQDAGVDRLRATGGAAGDVHRPAEGEAPSGRSGKVRQQRVELLGGVDDEPGFDVTEDAVPLGRREPRVEGHREDAGREQSDHQVDVRRRAGPQERHPVPGMQVDRLAHLRDATARRTPDGGASGAVGPYAPKVEIDQGPRAVGSVLAAAEAASPVEAVEAVTRELGLALGATWASFLIADLSGRAVVRLAHVRLATVDGVDASTPIAP